MNTKTPSTSLRSHPSEPLPPQKPHRWGWLLAPLALLLLLGLSQSGCPQPPDEPAPADSAAEPSPDTGPQDTPQDGQPDGKAQVGPLDQALKADETRAGQITKESELITGPSALSKIGDWRIYNSKVAFVLHGVGHSRFFSQGTGQLIDASVVDDKGSASHDLLEEIFPAFGLIRVIQATKIEVIEPGGEGKQAVIRVTGTDVGIPTIDEVIKSKPFSGQIEVDYILKPGATHIEIVTRLIDGVRIKDLQMGDGLLLGDNTKLFGPGVGLNTGDVTGKPIPYFASFGVGASYLVAPSDPKGSLVVPLTEAAIYPAFGGFASADEDKSEYRRMLFVGDGRLEPMLASLREVQATSTDGYKTIKGTIQGVDAADMPRVEIFLRTTGDDAVELSQTRPDAAGTFSFSAPDGTYELVASFQGRTQLRKAVSFGSDHQLTFAPGPHLKLAIKEKQLDGSTGGFVPVRVELQGPTYIRLDLIKDGQLIPVPPGKYTITVSRGLTHEYWQKEMTFEAKDATIDQEVILAKVIDTSGYVGSDMHLHATPSSDSELPMKERVSALVAEGLNFAVATDHDTFTDYSPIVKQLALTPWLRTAIGQEVSLLSAHFCIYPLPAIPTDEPRYFGPGWGEYKDRVYQRTLPGPELWGNIRKKYDAKIIQINHPRSSQSYLSSIEYDPKKGIKALKDGVFNDNWDVIELYNGKRRENFLDINIKDWFSFLNQGLYKTGVGNSDSHGASQRPGMPRTLIASPTQAGDKIDPATIAASLKANKAIIYAGPMIKLTTPQGDGPGTQLKGAEVPLTIEITAPSWIPVSYVKIYANGELLQQIDVPESKDVMRLKQTIQLKPSKDTWYVVFAGDDKKTMAPIYSSYTPVSMTNPIYLDVDSDGFKAPGLPQP